VTTTQIARAGTSRLNAPAVELQQKGPRFGGGFASSGWKRVYYIAGDHENVTPDEAAG